MLKSFSAQTNPLGAINFKGTWDATANSPALASSVGTKGDYYVVSTAGSTALNGISNWGIGDWAVFNGSVWQRVEGGADVNAVNLTVSGSTTLSGTVRAQTLTIGLGGQTSVATNTALGFEALNSASLTGTNNVGVGYGALLSNTSGSNNSAVGFAALILNTTGGANSATGAYALYSNTTGSQNSAVGISALQNNTTGANNSAVGYAALLNYNTSNNTAVGVEAAKGSSTVANNTGTNLTAVGYQALLNNTSGSYNSAVGHGALFANTTGNQSNAMGWGALLANTTGSNNTAMGHSALYANTTGGSNTTLGATSLYANTTGVNNCALGVSALQSNTTGNSNSAFGLQALILNTTGSGNSALGQNALLSNTTGSSNASVGDNAGDAITTGSRNTIIGANSDPSAAAGIDQTVVGEGLTGKGDDTAFIGGTNGAYNEKNVTTWETTSDARIKKNIVSNNVGLEVISQIDVRNFQYRTAEEITDLPASAAINQSGTQLGVIAQELQAVLPECVTENSTGVLSVNTDQLIWYLINSVKQLSAEIQLLKGA
jgi:hypothetical protein